MTSGKLYQQLLCMFGLLVALCPPLSAHETHLSNPGISFPERKIMILNSYHPGYAWSDAISHAARSLLEPAGITVREIYLDSKRRATPAEIEQAARSAKQEIDRWQPDLLIACDDNASKYLVASYLKDAALPVVFCGVNGDSSVYGYPFSNATGIEEVHFAEPLARELRRFARGDRLGILSGNVLSDRRNVEHYKQVLKTPFAREIYVETFAEWKSAFRQLQEDVDILLLVYSESIRGWNNAESVRFVKQHIRIPTGATEERLLPVSLIVYAHVPQEQGHFCAATAFRIFQGESPGNIPIQKKNQSRLLINLDLAEQLGLSFPLSLLKTAESYRHGISP